MKDIEIKFSYRKKRDTAVKIKPGNLLFQVQPKEPPPAVDPVKMLKEALDRPIGTPPLEQLVRREDRVLIIIDDYTRPTPTQIILPVLIDRLNKAGIPDSRITIMTAAGTHRPMTKEELTAKCGENVFGRIHVLNHEFDRMENLVDLGKTPNGTDIHINRLVLDSDFIISVGNIIPHAYAGFSAGSKSIQPGVSGELTTNQTHYLTERLKINRKPGMNLGKADNPIRREMDEVARKVALRFIVNTVLDSSNRVVKMVAGYFVEAHREGIKSSESIYKVDIPALADVVITDSYPATCDFWQGGKVLYTASMAAKRDGVIVLLAPCLEGFSQHDKFYELLKLAPDEIAARVSSGEEDNLFIAAPAVNVKRVSQMNRIIVVTEGLTEEEVTNVGFEYRATAQDALDRAMEIAGEKAMVTTMTVGGNIYPSPR